MIIVQLTGGMGNQMFQYALGRHLAIKHDTILKLDLSFFKTYNWHEYSLSPLNIKEYIASDKEIKESKGLPSNPFERILKKINLFKPKGKELTEVGLAFIPEIISKSIESCYLQGYWQSEKYFLPISDILKVEFTINKPLLGLNKEYLFKIKSSNSVSLHVRRGVYATVSEVNKAHGLTSMEFYHKAVNFLISKNTDIILFVFSDDIPWCRQNLKFDIECVYIDNNDDKTDYEDMRLMSHCKHNILANSTFSWWAAWINNNPTKIVIAPEKWFNDPSRETKDILPEKWLKF